MMITNTFNEQAQAKGAAARTHLLSVASRPVWNIVGGAINGVEAHLFGPPLSFWWEDEDDAEMPLCGYTITDSGIAVIPIHGTLVDSEPSWWMSYLGYCSIPAIARAVAAAGSDGNVKDILLDVDSPGGHVSGLAAACDAVWAVRQSGEKRIWAACKKVASAAYEIASQCNKMYLSPDGMGGCIGTLYLLSDWSGYYTQMGIVNLRVASDGAETYKGAGARGTKITPLQEADFKRLCNEYRALFNAIIQRGRGFDQATMKALADGRIHIGANALQLSLVDGIATPEAVLSALGGGDDLDDLEGPPSQADPDTDTDTDTDDDPDGDDDNDEPEDGKPKANIKQESDLENSNFIDTLVARLKGEGDKKAEDKSASQEAAHPVLTAALSAGLDTPEKLQAMLDERTTRQQADTTSAQQALTAAREAASKAAVTAFGQNSAELNEAQETIAALDSVAALSAMTTAYKAARPRQLRPGSPQQTETSKITLTEDAGNTAQDKIQEGLTASNVYESRRGNHKSLASRR